MTVNMRTETMQSMYQWIESTDISDLSITTKQQINVFCQNIPYITSKHQKKHKCVTKEFIMKLILCLKQINNSEENTVWHRKYVFYEEPDFIAAVKNSDNLPNVVIPIAFECRNDKWYIASSDTFSKARSRIVLSLQLSQ